MSVRPSKNKKKSELLEDLKSPLASSFYLEYIKVEKTSYKISTELIERMLEKAKETKKIPLLILDFKKYTLKSIITQRTHDNLSA